MAGNYLERLRIAVQIYHDCPEQSLGRVRINLGEDTEDYEIRAGINTVIFDCTVYSAGEHELCLTILEQSVPMKVWDLRLHGISVGNNLLNCVYTTQSGENKPNFLHLDQLGTWRWHFRAPIHESSTWRIGLV